MSHPRALPYETPPESVRLRLLLNPTADNIITRWAWSKYVAFSLGMCRVSHLLLNHLHTIHPAVSTAALNFYRQLFYSPIKIVSVIFYSFVFVGIQNHLPFFCNEITQYMHFVIVRQILVVAPIFRISSIDYFLILSIMYLQFYIKFEQLFHFEYDIT